MFLYQERVNSISIIVAERGRERERVQYHLLENHASSSLAHMGSGKCVFLSEKRTIGPTQPFLPGKTLAQLRTIWLDVIVLDCTLETKRSGDDGVGVEESQTMCLRIMYNDLPSPCETMFE